MRTAGNAITDRLLRVIERIDAGLDLSRQQPVANSMIGTALNATNTMRAMPCSIQFISNCVHFSRHIAAARVRKVRYLLAASRYLFSASNKAGTPETVCKLSASVTEAGLT